MNEMEFAELAAGHALNALSDADEQRYADALVAHPQWRRSAEIDERTVALLADNVESVTPPASVRDALLAKIALTPQNPAADPDQTPLSSLDAPDASDAPDPSNTSASAPAAPRRRGRLLFALAASVALIVGIGIGAAVLGSQLSRSASVIALEQIESSADAQQASIELESGATATAHWSQSVGEAVLVAEGLEGLDDDSSYELWFVRDDGPVSAGVFDADAGTATALLDGAMQAGDVIAVTVEPAGGSPTGQPTTDPIIVIPTA